ncbi:hypothetical protein Asppvi_005519 [Aspergillus pseudoviridinutans]|uniref:Isopenicillin N synthase-like Fe(2+) 2OG dioxygenase domain-containing protein n=1 Tax=Aspergillus pseudoviridinutans TaxID=1517512 RepID=A0A9P3BE25_9EURO|nr:uncharacterized protein Asppvi_005519 [Aspergillus pseudoviridinutans]GIJ86628.1 hypothetical protein Asppvi_005519 [Aspergillus pseudoviridinutans]
MATQTTQLNLPLTASTEPLEQYFFYVTFGLTQEQVDRQFAIAKEFFSLPEGESRSFRAPLEEVIYNGYRALGSIEILPGLRDNIEFYNIMKFLPQYERTHPDAIWRHWAEIERFLRHVHEHIAYRLLPLVAIILEIPKTNSKGATCMIPTAKAACDTCATVRAPLTRTRTTRASIHEVTQTTVPLHLSSSSPVAGLQVKKYDDSEWEYLRIPPGTIAVNIADLLSILSNGYLKSGVHRVITPPEDQQHLDRMGVLYFVRPSDRLNLRTVDSPLFAKAGLLQRGDQRDQHPCA